MHSSVSEGKPGYREWGQPVDLNCINDSRLVAIARGEQEYFDPNGIPTATEACKSNALMRCCKDLGVASELWLVNCPLTACLDGKITFNPLCQGPPVYPSV